MVSKIKSKEGTPSEVLDLYGSALRFLGNDVDKMRAILGTSDADLAKISDDIEAVHNFSKLGAFLFGPHRKKVQSAKLTALLHEKLAELHNKDVAEEVLRQKKEQFLEAAEEFFDEPKGKYPVMLTFRGLALPGVKAPWDMTVIDWILNDR